MAGNDARAPPREPGRGGRNPLSPRRGTALPTAQSGSGSPRPHWRQGRGGSSAHSELQARMRQEHRRKQAGTRTTPRLPPRRGSIERGKLDHSAKNDDAAGVHALTGLAVDPARVLSMRRDGRERQHSDDGKEEIQNRERASESSQGASRDSPAAKRAENSVGNPTPVRPRDSGTEEGWRPGRSGRIQSRHRALKC